MAGRNAFYAQSGGVSAVINSSACGVLQTARRYPDQIVKVYAGHNGILGALTEDLIDTSLESGTRDSRAQTYSRVLRSDRAATSSGRSTNTVQNMRV